MNCAAGSASFKEGSASPLDDCMKCQQGFYGAGGAGQCLPMNCARGHYASGIASGAKHMLHGCHQCPAGTKSLGGSVTECITVDSCRPGYAPSVAGAGDDDEACAPVSMGFYAVGGAGSLALPMSCPPGSVATKPAATSELDGCVACEGATFSEGGASIACQVKQCDLGKYSRKDGGTSASDGCELCPAGKFRDKKAQVTFVPAKISALISDWCNDKQCPPGTFSWTMGAISLDESCQTVRENGRCPWNHMLIGL